MSELDKDKCTGCFGAANNDCDQCSRRGGDGLKRMREMTWDDYGISRHRYAELKAFCLQYEEKKSKINRGICGVKYKDTPGGGTRKDSLEQEAIRNVMYQKDCEMIEQAAIAAAPEIYQYIIKSVSNDLSYQYIEYDDKLGRIPVGINEFYGYRRLFYHYLDKLKIGDKIDLVS